MARVTKFGKRDVAFEIAGLQLQIVIGIYNEMDRQKVSRQELARRLGVSERYLQDLLDGEIGITVLQMVRLARAMNFQWRIRPWSAGKKGGAR